LVDSASEAFKVCGYHNQQAQKWFNRETSTDESHTLYMQEVVPLPLVISRILEGPYNASLHMCHYFFDVPEVMEA
jgi:hypothetical protein